LSGALNVTKLRLGHLLKAFRADEPAFQNARPPYVERMTRLICSYPRSASVAVDAADMSAEIDQVSRNT